MRHIYTLARLLLLDYMQGVQIAVVQRARASGRIGVQTLRAYVRARTALGTVYRTRARVWRGVWVVRGVSRRAACVEYVRLVAPRPPLPSGRRAARAVERAVCRVRCRPGRWAAEGRVCDLFGLFRKKYSCSDTDTSARLALCQSEEQRRARKQLSVQDASDRIRRYDAKLSRGNGGEEAGTHGEE